eukprot:5148179-Prymnesium_polylepis.1
MCLDFCIRCTTSGGACGGRGPEVSEDGASTHDGTRVDAPLAERRAPGRRRRARRPALEVELEAAGRRAPAPRAPSAPRRLAPPRLTL